MFSGFYCTAQEVKSLKQTKVNDQSTVFVVLRGIRSEGVKGCSNCNVSGRLASGLGLTSFTINNLKDFKYNEKQNILQVKYLITKVEGKIRLGGMTVFGPYGNKARLGGCKSYGFGCPPPANRVGKTKY